MRKGLKFAAESKLGWALNNDKIGGLKPGWGM